MRKIKIHLSFDYQFRIHYGDLTVDDLYVGFGSGFIDGKDPRSGVEFAVQAVSHGYSIEMVMPLVNLQLSPDSLFGFEVKVNDADATVRNSIRKWWSDNANTWKDAGLFGTAQFIGGDVNMTAPVVGPAFPTHFVLYPSYPNPFNSITTVNYEIPRNCQVRLKIYNLRGQEIKNLFEGDPGPGRYQARWDAMDKFDQPVACGIYLIRFESDEFSTTVKTVYTE